MAKPKTATPRSAEAPPVAAGPGIAVTAVRIVPLDEGLYVLRVGEIAGPGGTIAGMTVPVAHVSVPFADDGNDIEIVASYPSRGPWIGKQGGTVVLRSPARGGQVIVTAYGTPGQPSSELPIDLRRLDRMDEPALADAPTASAVPAAGSPAAGPGRDVATEVLLHIERAGDRLFPGRGWVGALGRRMRIEAFSIRPLGHLVPADLEMKGYLPNGGETPWVPGGVLCGTRGRGLPLTGFAVRVVPQRADRFQVQYQGSFFSGGISEVRQNGEPCRASGDDPLEAINIRLIEQGADSEPEAEAGAPDC